MSVKIVLVLSTLILMCIPNKETWKVAIKIVLFQEIMDEVVLKVSFILTLRILAVNGASKFK